MQILCPYCHSEHVQRMLQSPAQASDDSSHLLGTSATFASIGAGLSKSLGGQIPISPWIGGIAGAVIGGLFGGLLDTPQRAAPQLPISYFQCQSCRQSFM